MAYTKGAQVALPDNTKKTENINKTNKNGIKTILVFFEKKNPNNSKKISFIGQYP
jgi:hypothetical protein